jgi:hypothetical protein
LIFADKKVIQEKVLPIIFEKTAILVQIYSQNKKELAHRKEQEIAESYSAKLYR